MTKRQTCFLGTSSYKIVPTNMQGMLRERRGSGKEWSEPCIDRLTRSNGGSQPTANLFSSSSPMVKADTCHGMTRDLTTCLAAWQLLLRVVGHQSELPP